MRHLKIVVMNNSTKADESKRDILYDDLDPNRQCLKLELKQELNGLGTLQIILPATNFSYSYSFREIDTLCYVFLDGEYGTAEPIFGGRLYSAEIDIQGNKTLIFEDLLARLATMPISNDLYRLCQDNQTVTVWNALLYICRGYTKGFGVTSGVTGNITCGTEQFARDSQTATAIRNAEVKLEDITIDSSLLDILKLIVEKVGNNYRFNLKTGYYENGVEYNLIGIFEISSVYEESILPSHITNYKAESSAEPFCNRIYGYVPLEGSENDNKEYYGSIALLADFTEGDYTHIQGRDYVELATGEYGTQKIGVVSKTIVVETVKKANILQTTTASVAKLKKECLKHLTRSLKNLNSYAVDIVDGYALNGDYGHYKVGEKVRMPQLGNLKTFTAVITSRSYDLLNPVNDTIVVEKSYKKLTDILK